MADILTVLAIPRIYTLFQYAMGADRVRRRYVAEYVRPRVGDAILDVGCGPADILDYLPPGVSYHGVDLSEAYVAAARQRFGDRGTFECRAVADLAADRPGAFDIVTVNGVLHHLSDGDARHLFEVAARVLKPGGRWVSLDGCYVQGQSRVAKWMLDRDRGEFVRTEAAYLALIREAFPDTRATVRHDLIRIPYTHVILEARNG